MDIDKIKQMVKTGKDYYYKSRSGDEVGNGPYISFNLDTGMFNLHSGGFVVQKSKNFDLIFARGKELLGESVKKKSNNTNLRKFIRKTLKEEKSRKIISEGTLTNDLQEIIRDLERVVPNIGSSTYNSAVKSSIRVSISDLQNLLTKL